MPLKQRSDIGDAYKWRLRDLYESDDAWRKAFAAMNGKLGTLARYKGKLSDMNALYECLREKDALCEQAEKLYVYATMSMHQDSRDSAYQGMADEAESFLIKLMAAMSFIDPEILAVDENVLTNAMSEGGTLHFYKHILEDLLRQKAHVLSPEMEELLTSAAEIGNAAENIYSMITDADMKFGDVTDDDGNTVTLTQGRYISLMESQKQDVRKNTFETYYASYLKQKNTFAASYAASVKKDVFFAKARKYGSALEAALSSGNIPPSVYTNLIDTVHKRLPDMHRYVRLRKKLLGVSELHMYDLYTPIVKDISVKVPYGEAKETVLRALAPLGKDYLEAVKTGYSNGWIDVYENEGKRSGAYAWGAYGTHPYILLNYDDKLNDMFTLAHEAGHAMHSHYSWSNQPYAYGDYTIFVAEVASTVNECLLLDHLLQTNKDPVYRQYLLNHALEQFRGTLFRQTMFAEFEMKTHNMAEKGVPLTLEALNALYRELNTRYYGPDIVLDDAIDIEWARIPHFYSAFYVYQYATGYSAAVALSEGILRGKDKAAENYRAFLSGGSSDYSINLLKTAGVDMSGPGPVEAALNRFAEVLSEMEKI